jgi:hypothetical protein
VRELQSGLWHWQAPHPDWTPAERWPQIVSSYAIDDGTRVLLFDPLAVPSEIIELAADREPVIVLTAPWHERDTKGLVERLRARVVAPPPDTADDLMQKYGITAEQAGNGSPDLAWLLAGNRGEARFYSAGDRLPIGMEAFLGREHNDLVLWIDRVGAVISGDTWSTSDEACRSTTGCGAALREKRSRSGSGPSSNGRSRSCSRRTEHRRTGLRLRARSPDATGPLIFTPPLVRVGPG